MEIQSPRYVIAGQLKREYLILPSGQALLDMPGGNALFAAAGVAVWEPSPPPGVVARVGADYPAEWIEDFERRGLDTRGIRRASQPIDLISFAAYTSRSERSTQDPVAHFARTGQALPKALLGYWNQAASVDSRTQLRPTSLRQADIPADFLDASAAHLCPLDYLTHNLLPAVLRQAEFTTITLDPAPGYMNSTFWDNVPALLTGLTAFLPSEEEMISLFQGRSQDLWEMAEALAAYGCEHIVIKRGEGGQLVYDSATRTHWDISAYPSRVVDPSGAGDAFCGGFLSGYRRTYDALEAALHGNISASLTVEGVGPFFAMEALPGLAQARLEALRQSVRKV